MRDEQARPPDTEPALAREIENLRPSTAEFDKMVDYPELPVDGSHHRMN